MGQGSARQVGLNHRLARLRIGGVGRLERQACRGERVCFGATLRKDVLDGTHLFEGAAVRTAGDGDLGTAQGCTGLQGTDGLQGLERRPQEERFVGVAETQGDFSLGGEDDEASTVGGFG